MAEDDQQKTRVRAWLVVMLAYVGGFVDGVGYLVLFHMFTSHMSGNTIAGGVHLGTQRWSESVHRLVPLPAFVVGVACGRAVVEYLAMRRLRSPLAIAFIVEAALLSVFVACGAPVLRNGELRPASEVAFYLLAILPALAMGFQNATLRKVGGGTVRTTYISGVLTDFAEGTVDLLYWLGGARKGKAPVAVSGLTLLLALWTGYFLGAVLGAVTEQRWNLLCLLVPIACLAVLAVVDFALPLSLPSERTRSNRPPTLTLSLNGHQARVYLVA